MKGTVLITGASSGIGLATAIHFGRKSYHVYAGVRSRDTAVNLMKVIQDGQLPIDILDLDVRDVSSVAAAVRAVISRSGSIDVLINNAGIGGGGAIEEVAVEWAQDLFDTNYFGAVRLIKATLPHMRKRRSGSIVNVSSIVGRVAPAAHGHYSASKWALEGMSEALAQEVRPYDIRVIVIEPGVVLTPIFSKARRQLDLESPYYDAVRRLVLMFQKQLQHPTMPETVAAAIEAAIDDPNPRFRYVVGADAELLLVGRRGISDEQWVEDGQAMSDGEYFDLMRRRYGLELA